MEKEERTDQESEEHNGVPESVEEEAEEVSIPFEDLMKNLRNLVFEQPEVLLVIIETLFDMLISKEIMTEEEMEALIRASVNRWWRESRAE